ncbi:MAG: 2-oxoacid:acceptor oxidoreductase family protein [Peptostreptococcaceae bacterium]|nr:2-oxoacid:acceptor oxidoreductase family protein [Peptostreptococcaceae bacterium]
MKTEIRLSGSGGQGVILIGVVIAEAGIELGKNAIQSQSYGPEARGGASKAEVVISDEEIYFTKVLKPNIFLALTQDSYDKYNKEVIDGGICIVDYMVKTGDEAKNRIVHRLPIVDTARDVLGKSMVTNIVALGALSQVLEGLTEDALKTAMLHRIPKGTEELNLQAFAEGIKLMKQYSK